MWSINILLIGKTGVGKSTLINSFLNSEKAPTGSGSPVTKKLEKYKIPEHSLTFLNTKGLELKDNYPDIIGFLKIAMERIKIDQKNKIDVVWLCIQEDCRRVDSVESLICDSFEKISIPVIVVITKSRSDDGFSDFVKSTLKTAKAVVNIRSIPEKISYDGCTLKLKTKGLGELLKSTLKIVDL